MTFAPADHPPAGTLLSIASPVLGCDNRAVFGTASSSNPLTFTNMTLAANEAAAFPVRPIIDMPCSALWYVGGNTTGNVDIGLYDSGLNLVVSSGSHANTAAFVEKTLAFFLRAGNLYYVAVAANNTGSSFLCLANPLAAGLVRKTSSFALPSSLSSPTSTSTTNTGWPVCGVKIAA